MPIYEYLCTTCGQKFELLFSYKDSNVKDCKFCGSPNINRAMSSYSLLFNKTNQKKSFNKSNSTQSCVGCNTNNCSGCK